METKINHERLILSAIVCLIQVDAPTSLLAFVVLVIANKYEEN